MSRVRRRSRGGKGATAYLVLAAAVTLVLLVAVNRRNVTAGLNVPIRYDDFVFTVLNVRKTSAGETIGPVPSAGRTGYVVTLRVDNRAKRVNFTFKDDFAVLFDSRQRAYRVIPDAQKAVEATYKEGNPTAKPLPAGTSALKDLVYDIPPGAEGLRLKIMTSGPVGDWLETVTSGNKQFAIP